MSLIPKNDHENFYYYAIQFKSDGFSKRELSKRALDVSNVLEYHFLGQIGQLQDYFLVAHPKNSNYEPSLLKKRLESVSEEIVWVSQQVPTKRLFKRALSSSDKAKLLITDPGFSNQWHLENLEQPGNDINVTGLWKQGIHGENVTVCFLDDGIDYNHQDLKDAFYAAGSFDFNDHENLPTPKLSDDTHGTRCAGEVAAQRNNVCGIGVAWKTRVSGVRILSGKLTEADEAAAINYDFKNNHIYSCSWGPADNGRAMDAPPRIVADAFLNGIVNGRDGKGSLFVFATGNGGNLFDNCNFDGYTNSIYTITIGAIDRLNQHPKYSEECSAQMAVTYSSGSGAHIYTCDVGNDACTNGHGGTSAAAPLASGIYALVMSVRPDFTWRDFQHITVKTAVPVSLTDPDWIKVAKNRLYNHRYGYGKLDAYSLVRAAKSHNLVQPQTRFTSPVIQVNTVMPEGPPGVVSTFELTKSHLDSVDLARLEHVTVSVDISYPFRGDIVIQLISPNQYVSLLGSRRPYDDNPDGFRNWTFMTVKHWDENPLGVWTLNVLDMNNPQYQGTLNHWSITFWGEKSGGNNTDIIIEPPVDNEGDTSAAIVFIIIIAVAVAIGGVVWYLRKRRNYHPLDYEFQVLNDENLDDFDDEFDKVELGGQKQKLFNIDDEESPV